LILALDGVEPLAGVGGIQVIALPHVNLLAVIVAAAAGFLVSGLYWAVLTPAYLRHLGRPAEEARPTPAQFAVAFVTRVLLAWVLAVFVGWAGANGAGAGAEIGFLAWLGFVVTLAIGQAAFERKPWQVLAIGLPESLIGLVLLGAIVGAWR
jgi:hypothetical protein